MVPIEMVWEMSCIHAGFEACEFLVRTENRSELVEIVQNHAERIHGVAVSREHVERIARGA